MRNLNLLFYKEYYQRLGKPDFQNDVIRNNTQLINTSFDDKNDYIMPPVDDCQSFVLKVVYPGLLIGTGIPHGVGKLGNISKKTADPDEDKNSEDVNMGFTFDYVTGQPIIPGSSVKGVLRSHFKYHTGAVVEILKNNDYPDIDSQTVAALEKEIFENECIFFDAVIRKGDAQGKLLGFDFITHHKSATQNPVPIRMIKVLPDVLFEFRFSISNKEINGLKFSAGKIKWLFRELILLFGAGAKTNVGYGVFDNNGSVLPKTNSQGKGGKNSGKKKQQKKSVPVPDDDMPEWKKKLMGLRT